MGNKPLYKVGKVVHSDRNRQVFYEVLVRQDDHWIPQMDSCNGYAYQEVPLLERDAKKKAFAIQRIRNEDSKRIYSGAAYFPISHLCSGMDLEEVVQHCKDLTEEIRVEDFKERSSLDCNEVWLEQKAEGGSE